MATKPMRLREAARAVVDLSERQSDGSYAISSKVVDALWRVLLDLGERQSSEPAAALRAKAQETSDDQQ